jgi:hypothetical protein
LIFTRPLKIISTVCSEIPAVDQRRHSHRDHEPRRTSSEEPLWKAMLAVLEGDTPAHDLLNGGLEKGWHGAVPPREDYDKVMCPNDGAFCLDQAFRKTRARMTGFDPHSDRSLPSIAMPAREKPAD